MQSVRMLGNYVFNLAKDQGVENSRLAEILDCSEQQVVAFFKGRLFVSFSQLLSLADTLNVSVDALLAGDEESYNKSVVHCMNDFSDPANREFILDIIDDYIDLKDAAEGK